MRACLNAWMPPMKVLFSVLLTLVLGSSFAATPPASMPMTTAAPLKGQVLETVDAGQYTYLRLKTKDGEIWAAVIKAPVAKGAQVTIQNPMLMTNFESKTLKKTFDKIIFGTLASSGATPPETQFLSAHAGTSKPMEPPVEKVAKATGPEARTVAEVAAQSGQLKGRTVAVRGKVVKVSSNIMGKNWAHLRDGSGSAADGSNDLIVTTKQVVTVGDVVVARGVVRTNVDLGSGYAYKVLIEDAKISK
jgi:hypothetical protein